MNNLYDLVKRIDALTANSQQVLNALIRSCVASGSSSGYKVTKYGNEIVLTRSDIYRLYDFYQSWEAENFPADEASFYSILSAADTRWRKTASEDSTLATDAVVKHSQILFMTSADASKTGTGNYDYWLERIRNSVSPKVTVSTAPIPLNLRTPLYDENLSVKSFSQYETYLFPIGYQRAELLGIPGDEESYLAGGRNWTIDVTENLTFSGNRIFLGKISNPDNRLANYGDSVNTLSWGNESYAFKDESAAFGYQSVAIAPGAVVFGHRCRGFGEESFTAGGEELVTVGDRGFTSNYVNYAIGDNSFAANRKTVAGGYPYRFEFMTSSDLTTVPCETIEISTEGKCVATSTLQAQSLTASKKVIRVLASAITTSGMPFEIKEGDTVVVYDQTYNGTTRSFGSTSYISGGVSACDPTGYASTKFVTTVTAVSPHYETRSGGTKALVDVQLTLASPIPVESSLYNLTGGYLSRLASSVSTRNETLGQNGNIRLRLGENSATFGLNTIATGANQMVAGMNNTSNTEANFIVGTGVTSYVSQYARSNGLVVAPYYGYMRTTNGNAVMGVSGGDAYSGDLDDVRLYRGSFMFSAGAPSVSTGTSYVRSGSSYVRATPSGSRMETYMYDGTQSAVIAAASAPGVLVNPSYNVTTVFSSLQGTAVIAAGSYLRSDGTSEGYVSNALLTRSNIIRTANDNGVAIYAQDGIEIRNTENRFGRGINIETCSYLRLNFKSLELKGNTFGQLTATDDARSFWLAQNGGGGTTGAVTDIKYGNTTGHSGFYYGTTGNYFDMPFAPKEWSGQSLHVINSTVYNNNDKLYHTASLSIVDEPNMDAYRSTMGSSYINSTYWRPMVTVSAYSGAGNSNTMGRAKSFQLATFDDAMDSNVWSSGVMMRCGYSTLVAVKNDSTVIGPLTATNGYIFMPVTTLNSDWTISDKFRVIPASMENVRTLGMDNDYKNTLLSTFTSKFDVLKPIGSSAWGLGAGTITMSYTLNGNWLNMEMRVSASGSGSILDFSSSYKAIRIPFFIGCTTDSHTGNPGSSIAVYEAQNPSNDGYSTKYRIVPGVVTTASWTASSDGNIDYGRYHAEAKVFNDGFMYVQIRDVTPGSSGANGHGFRITFSGIVPFVANASCRSDWISPEWINSVRGKYGLDSGTAGRRYGDVIDDMETDE